MSEGNVWSSSLDSEIGFWRRWFNDPKHDAGRQARIAGTRIFAQYYVDLIGAPPNTPLRVLDVGSGPISTLGSAAKNNTIELVCTDALADHYNALLEENGHVDLPSIKKVKGEDLLREFGPAAFHVVHCANALDHFEDPALSFENMYRVCRPGGAVVVISVENEGEREGYQGLHQWNLKATDQGLLLSSRTHTVNLLDRAPGYERYSWHYLASPPEFRVFRVTIMRGLA